MDGRGQEFNDMGGNGEEFSGRVPDVSLDAPLEEAGINAPLDPVDPDHRLGWDSGEALAGPADPEDMPVVADVAPDDTGADVPLDPPFTADFTAGQLAEGVNAAGLDAEPIDPSSADSSNESDQPSRTESGTLWSEDILQELLGRLTPENNRATVGEAPPEGTPEFALFVQNFVHRELADIMDRRRHPREPGNPEG